MPSKPALVFVHGAWHDKACFTPITSILSSRYGYNITLVSLPSVGSELRGHQPPQDWNQDVNAVRAAILKHLKDGEDVVLIAHSYGGCPASQGAEGLGKKEAREQPGIVRLLWITALALPMGAWVWERTGGKPAFPEKVAIMARIDSKPAHGLDM